MITIGMIKNFTLKPGAKRNRRFLQNTRHIELRYQLQLVNLWTPAAPAGAPITIDQAALRRAMRHKRMVRFTYKDLLEKVSARLVRPLIMAFYGQVWLLSAQCESRVGFRVFRIDRMVELSVSADGFANEPGQTAEDFLNQDSYRGAGK